MTFEEGTCAAWLHDLLKPHVTEVLVCDPRKNALLKVRNKNEREDACKLGYFTERLDPGPMRQALLSLIRGAKRNKAFDACRLIGLAIDRTGAGWRTPHGCNLCRAKQILGYQHSFVMVSVVGTGLSLPFDGEPYGPNGSEYTAGQRLLRRVIGNAGNRLAQYVVVDRVLFLMSSRVPKSLVY